MFATIFAALLYLITAWIIWRRPNLVLERLLPPVALLLHAAVLATYVFHGGRITIGFNESLSLFAWQSALLLWVLCFREPLRILGVAIYPLAAVAATSVVIWPSPPGDIMVDDWHVQLHIALSLFSAGLLTLAAVQSILLAVQDRLLHRSQLTHLARALPPVQTMERLLFQLIAIGFVLLSLTLISGMWFIRNWMAQHLAHKTILSITAWLIFGTLLWGRFRHGWRGRTAIRWALAGYAMLILAYFGSKLILEEILGKHWT
ncbi:cytochrome C assembly family protein [Solimonas marina]|uniref:Cytochrome c biogenesis protein CcsA n=1 Tax=Solimonas marina TaxID=2714601 RepID=A0A969W8V3_9GAMM|nr:cytochrome c biogenesis protein CcsA [Solimonas marina]NKF22527.1 cytochrome c biogenesis protein CcsA [Solimonas marina]